MSTDEATSPEVAGMEPSPPRKQGSVLRIVLIVLLVVAVIALVVDMRARSAAEELHNSIMELHESAPAREKPTIEAVHERAAREPTETYDHHQAANTKVEEYRYRGGLPWRTYTVYVYYRTKPEVRLYSVSLNQPEEF
jgi:hypothetical protein